MHPQPNSCFSFGLVSLALHHIKLRTWEYIFPVSVDKHSLGFVLSFEYYCLSFKILLPFVDLSRKHEDTKSFFPVSSEMCCRPGYEAFHNSFHFSH